jgi:hypothetical protein
MRVSNSILGLAGRALKMYQRDSITSFSATNTFTISYLKTLGLLPLSGNVGGNRLVICNPNQETPSSI